jgi:hypothetical protein
VNRVLFQLDLASGESLICFWSSLAAVHTAYFLVRPKKYSMKFILLLLFIFYISCSQLPYEQIKNDFLKNNPNYKVISVLPGEGDSDNVYIHIKYQKAGSNLTQEEIWLYQRDTGKWLPTKTIQ